MKTVFPFSVLTAIKNNLAAGIKLALGGSEVSASNPLPSELYQTRGASLAPVGHDNPIYTISGRGAAFLSLVVSKETGFIVHGINVAAGGVGKYPKIQVWNPADNTKEIVVYVFQTWNTTGTVTYQASYTNVALSAVETVKPKQNAFAGSSVQATAKIFVDNTQATLATDIISSVAVSAIVPNGSNVIPLTQAVLKPGQGVTFEGTTANVAMNAMVVFGEIAPL